MVGSKPRLLVAEPDHFAPAAMDILSSAFDLRLGPLTRKALLTSAPECAGVFVRLSHRIDAEFFARAASLKVVASPTTGLNHIDQAEATRRGIVVISLRGEREFLDGIHATAEHCWALLLSLLRRVPAAVESVNSGYWDRSAFRGRELFGKTLGVVGFGRLGAMVAGYAKAFGMQVLAADPAVTPPDWAEHVDLQTLAARSDIITLHVPYQPETERLIDARFFASLRPGALLVNTARGEIVDEAALLEALESGLLGGAALDVLCDENIASARESKALKAYARDHDSLLITPHIGGATEESMSATEVFIAEKLRQFAQTHLLAGEHQPRGS